MATLHFTTADFDEKVLGASVPVMVDFWAPWCGPCRMMGPLIDELSEEMGEQAVIGKVNIDENIQIAQRYGIMSIPTVIVFDKGNVISQEVGLRSKDALRKMLQIEISEEEEA